MVIRFSKVSDLRGEPIRNGESGPSPKRYGILEVQWKQAKASDEPVTVPTQAKMKPANCRRSFDGEGVAEETPCCTGSRK